MNPPAILVEAVSKAYRRYHEGATLAARIRAFWAHRGRREIFWALREVSFRIQPAQMVGVLGGNGAGKSTLLRLIGGVGRPDQGVIRTQGRVRALLDLGAGMHPDLTGIENAMVAGVVSGLTRREMRKRMEAVIGFAELEEFCESPLRTYSTGMQMRLAFSIAIHTDPDILLVDEVLAVGDLRFQRKCLDRIRQIKAQGCAILFVSHDSTTVRQLCDLALWLRSGQLVASGPADLVVSQYVAEMSAETRRRMPAGAPGADAGSPLKLGTNRFGSLEMEITGVRVLNRFRQPVQEVESGEPITVEISYLAPRPLPSPVFSVNLSSETAEDLVNVNTDAKGATMPTLEGSGTVLLSLDRLDLKAGQYHVNVGVYEAAWSHAYDYHWHVYPLVVLTAVRQFGLLNVPHRWMLETK